MKVVLTTEALSDLESIADYIALENPARAASFVSELVDEVGGLAICQTVFLLVPRYELLGIRRRIHGNYLIFYRVKPYRIEVIHILHGSRDY